jgi:hypothetical protein
MLVHLTNMMKIPLQRGTPWESFQRQVPLFLPLNSVHKGTDYLVGINVESLYGMDRGSEFACRVLRI